MSVDKDGLVAVLMGGWSSERNVSLASGAAVLKALRARGWRAEPVDVGRDLPARLAELRPSACWLALHGGHGEDGSVQGLLEVMGLPYTGSGVRASAVAMDKIATKRAVRDVPGIVLAPDAVVGPGAPMPQLGGPVIVKPSVGGSTIGMTRVTEPSQWAAARDAALAEHHEVLVEKIIVGDEITVAVLEGQALPVVRIVPDSGFFDFEAKYTKGRTRYEVPAPMPADVTERAQRAAEAAFRALGCRGLARADFLVPDDGQPVFLEINTIPGMTETSLSPMAAGATGMSFEVLVERLLLDASVDR